MESSRIFVRGLPPNCKDSDLRKHFDQFDSSDPLSSTLTDAHFIPNRRIGYVGYKTPKVAAQAVKHFNRSFIRMSRILAELARPVEDSPKTKKRRSSTSQSPERLSKKSRDGGNEVTNDKLAGFVRSLQHSSRGPTWSNEEYAPGQDEPQTREPDEPSNINDEEYQEPKEAFTEKPQHTTEAHPVTVAARESYEDASNESLTNNYLRQTEEARFTKDGTVLPDVIASDSDWLRSRTNRVLDLLEDDQVEKSLTQTQTSGAAGTISEHVRTQDSEVRIEKAMEQGLKEQRDGSPFGQHEEPPNGRLMVRNLLYDVSNEDILCHFEKFGRVEEVHICHDAKSGRSKGFAFVQYETSNEADAARLALNGTAFQGRNLSIEAASSKRDREPDETMLSRLPLKVQNQLKRRSMAPRENFKWNSLFMSTDAIMSSVASKLGVSKSDVLDPTSADAAVRQAHAETRVIQDTQSHFQRHGIDVESFKPAKRRGNSETVILVKNFPFGTTAPEIKIIFEKYGPVKRLIIPPSATIAIVEMQQSGHARTAFSALAYSKFKDSVLLLEKAPQNLFRQDMAEEIAASDNSPKPLQTDPQIEAAFEKQETSASSSLFVDKLPWSITTEELRNLFRPFEGFLSARVMVKADPRKSGQLLSRGFGFVEFRTKTQAKTALGVMNGHMLGSGQPLILRPSHKTVDAAEERRREDREKRHVNQQTKVVIKNLPFEATKKDVRSLFSPYGQLRSVRVPKKFDSSSRGFAFADFTSPKEAINALEALRNTHLLGRRLVLDFAATEAADAEEEIERMQRKVEKQIESVAIQKVSAGGRKKFRSDAADDDM